MEDRSNIIKEAIEYRKQLEKENAELKHTLQEIKKIAEHYIENEYIYMNYRDLRQIIRLINKAESEDNQ